MENIPENPGLTLSTVHHPIFTVDEESDDDESVTATTPILSRENVNAAIDNTPTVNDSPTASNDNTVNNTLTTHNDAVVYIDENNQTSITEPAPIENAALITPADCVNATTAVENSSIVIEKSR